MKLLRLVGIAATSICIMQWWRYWSVKLVCCWTHGGDMLATGTT